MSQPAVSLLIPFGFDDPRRDEIFRWVYARWKTTFPHFQICLGVDPSWQEMGGDSTYNRSRARNDAFRQADGDILVISDADTACGPHNVQEAIHIVRETGCWVIAHTVYYSLTEDFTEKLLRCEPDSDLHVRPFSYDWKMVNRSEAGVLVMPREAYETAEGYDERFQGWGYEDNAFAAKLKKRWGEPQRTYGDMFHLWHPRGDADFSQPHIKDNERLFEEIRDAA